MTTKGVSIVGNLEYGASRDDYGFNQLEGRFIAVPSAVGMARVRFALSCD